MDASPRPVAKHATPAIPVTQLQAWRAQLACGFSQIDPLFEDCMAQASAVLSPQGLEDYLHAAHVLGKMGRGPEPVLCFLQNWPAVVPRLGESALDAVMSTVRQINQSPNGAAIAPFIQVLPTLARRLPTADQLQRYMHLAVRLMQRTSVSIHGRHSTYPSPSLVVFFETAPQLLDLLSLQGLHNWVEYGIRNYPQHPEQQRDYFSLRSSDSRAVLQRERHGTLLVDHSRSLELYLRALWQDGDLLVPYPTLQDGSLKPMPYFDDLGIRLPDVYDERAGVSGIDRYRLALAHMAAHRRWSTAIFGDNFSPAQRLAIETFEDLRMDLLVMRTYPGLASALRALHPKPEAKACDPDTESCLRHRLAMLSRAVIDPAHPYTDDSLLAWVQQLSQVLTGTALASTEAMAELALRYLAQTRLQSDQLPNTRFDDTEVDYRDDNRHLWRFHELSDDEEMFEQAPPAAASQTPERLPPRLYPEWDYTSQTLRPDWVSVYEYLHPSGQASLIDDMLSQHQALAKQLKAMLDQLKPQDRQRIRFQEQGSDLDLDIALRALVDVQASGQPETRINLHHVSSGRSIAVTLLLDLSHSLNDTARGSTQSVLQLSQQAVALLAWAVSQLGDPLAIAGFQSNTRHEVRFQHLKGFDEDWGDTVKARLAAMKADYSTRMGAAMRHAARTLQQQVSDKKLLLVLTDGQPSDVDVADARLLIEDARHVVQELDSQGIFTYCINLDAQADTYVHDIFGARYTVLDNVSRLPEQLPKLFMALTR